jgi:hypothetical protein
MKKLFFTFSIIGLLLAVTPFVACSDQDDYLYWYDVEHICIYPDYNDYLMFELVKNEVLNGKLVIESGSVTFFVQDEHKRYVEDAGRLGPGDSYSFSIKPTHTGAQYMCWFDSSLQGTAKFYTNQLGIGSHRITAMLSDAPVSEEWKTYTNDTHGYSINFPAHWLVDDSNKDLVSIMDRVKGTVVDILIMTELEYVRREIEQAESDQYIHVLTKVKFGTSWETISYTVSDEDQLVFLNKELYTHIVTQATAPTYTLSMISSRELVTTPISINWANIDVIFNSFKFIEEEPAPSWPPYHGW